MLLEWVVFTEGESPVVEAIGLSTRELGEVLEGCVEGQEGVCV